MKLTFLGAAHEVTGSCTLLSACGKQILIDCGMEQGADIYENCDLPIAPGQIDLVLLTHAHIDHSGKLPALVAGGYSGPIHTTGATAELARIMLLDSAHIQEMEAEWKNRRARRGGAEEVLPSYTVADAETTAKLFAKHTYNTPCELCEGITARFLDAGHLLGSASIELTVREGEEERVLLFSGDVGNVNRPLLRDPQRPTRADFVVVESTYGDRCHEAAAEGDRAALLAEILQETFDRGGSVIIPSFAVGRTQELLYLLREVKARKLVKGHPSFPVWVDSSLAVEATKIYAKADIADYYDDESRACCARGGNVLEFEGLRVSVTADESKAINFDTTPKVVISSSGMCEAGRIRHHLKHNLWRREATVLFVGYQTPGTLGRILLDGAKTVRLFGEEVRVAATVRSMPGASGHADREMLLGWLGALEAPPKTVFVNHGEDAVCDGFAAYVAERLGYPTEAPYNGAAYDLTAGECLLEGNRRKLARKQQTRAPRTSAAFERLLMAGRRLLSVIERKRGASSKELAKFADQVNGLADRWERR